MSKRARRLELLCSDPHCFYCGREVGRKDSSVDHRTPRANGGTGTPKNLVLACLSCNAAKEDVPIERILCRLPRGAGIRIVNAQPEEKTMKNSSLPATAPASAGFDYEALESAIRRKSRDHAQAIHLIVKDTTENVLRIGQHLIAVREAMPQGRWLAWLKAEFRWSQPVASNFMQVAGKFGELDCVTQFQPSALYELIRGRMAPEAVTEAIAEARSGEVITSKHHAKNNAIEPSPLRRTALSRLRGYLTCFTQPLGPQKWDEIADALRDYADDLKLRVREIRSKTRSSRPRKSGDVEQPRIAGVA